MSDKAIGVIFGLIIGILLCGLLFALKYNVVVFSFPKLVT